MPHRLLHIPERLRKDLPLAVFRQQKGFFVSTRRSVRSHQSQQPQSKLLQTRAERDCCSAIDFQINQVARCFKRSDFFSFVFKDRRQRIHWCQSLPFEIAARVFSVLRALPLSMAVAAAVTPSFREFAFPSTCKPAAAFSKTQSRKGPS